MKPVKIPRETEIRTIYRHGEDAGEDLAQSVQVLEDRLAKNTHISDQPPSSEGVRTAVPKGLRKRHLRKNSG